VVFWSNLLGSVQLWEDAIDLPRLLDEGLQLDYPTNAANNTEMYVFLLGHRYYVKSLFVPQLAEGSPFGYFAMFKAAVFFIAIIPISAPSHSSGSIF